MHILAFVLVASTLGQIFAPVFHAMSWLLATYYSAVPNYVAAIAMLTITVMIISFPLNRASTRSMFKMQLLQPEVQKLRTKYKPSRDMTVQERQEMRQKLNEEMMALYRENNVSMAGGCLPNIVIFPIFIVLYDVVRGLTNTCAAVSAHATSCATAAQLKGVAHPVSLWAPRYIITGTRMYHNLAAAHGKMISFGINLASSVRTPQPTWVDVLPFVAVILIAIALQYIQLKQMTGRNTQTGQVAQQMQAMQKFMPLVMALIYVNIPAAVNVYFIFSSLFRIGQQEWMYRRDPQITHAMAQLKARRAATAGGGGKKGEVEPVPPMTPLPPSGLRGFRARIANALAPELMAGEANGGPAPAAGSGGRPAGGGASGRGGAGTGGRAAGARPGGGGSAGSRGASGAGGSGGAKGSKPAGGRSSGGGAGAASKGGTGSPAGGGAPKGTGGRGQRPAGSGGAKPATTNGAGDGAPAGNGSAAPRESGKRPRRPS